MARVSISIQDHIARVTLTRADKMNAMDDEMITAIIAAGEEVAASDARVVLLSGEGKSFCAGIDLGGLAAMVGQDMDALIVPRTHGGGTTNRWQEVVMIWHRLEIPVVAALHGAVYGAGMQLALGADIRIAEPDTKLAVMEMKWGIIPDMGGFVLLPRLLRDDVMKQLIYTAEPLGAADARDWGLVTTVADDAMAEAQALCEKIALKSPSAIRAAKRLCALARDVSPQDMLMAEAETQASLLGKPEQMEVVKAQLTGRTPEF